MVVRQRFAVNVKKWSKRTGLSLEQAARGSIIEIFKRVIDRSPVDKGTFRGNWQVDQRGFTFEKTDKSGAVTIAMMTTKVNAKPLGGVTSLINNAPYGERLEFGHSKQAPMGMIRITAKEFRAVAAKQASSVKR